ncbi:hypothetical protein [Kitasatospora fiedleri]|uniref:hypothetical protein n=1 Tax=Kitasatospora fiedleri TaxID=2991545 RepID=UPI00249B95FB|nr:hypothetical protein [Kitasatospora fiedleri]
MTRTEPVPNLPDERLCRPSGASRAGRRPTGDLRRDRTSGRMHAYAFAVDGAVERPAAEERARR